MTTLLPCPLCGFQIDVEHEDCITKWNTRTQS